MSFMDSVRYRLGRWKARNQAYESSLGNKAEPMSVFVHPSGPLLITKEAADATIARSEDPGDREHKEFGTEL